LAILLLPLANAAAAGTGTLNSFITAKTAGDSLQIDGRPSGKGNSGDGGLAGADDLGDGRLTGYS